MSPELTGKGIRTGDLSTAGKHELSQTFPGRFKGVIYRVSELWMSEVKPDLVEFDFAAEVPDLRSRHSGYKFRLLSIYAAKGFPWPTDFAQEGRKDTRAINIPTHVTQLRQALAGAVSATLGVPESEIGDIDSVIKIATTPERVKKRRKTLPKNS